MKRYTPEQEEYLAENYPRLPIEELCSELGYSKRSVITKLAKMGLYVKPEYTTKRGEKPITKRAIVSEICIFLGIDYIVGLEKCDKLGLVTLYEALFGEKP